MHEICYCNAQYFVNMNIWPIKVFILNILCKPILSSNGTYCVNCSHMDQYSNAKYTLSLIITMKTLLREREHFDSLVPIRSLPCCRRDVVTPVAIPSI